MRKKRLIVLLLLILGFASTVGRAIGPTATQNTGLPKIQRSVGPSFANVMLSDEAVGEVLVEIRLDASGNVSLAHASEGQAQLRTATEAAVKQWKFEPSTEPERTIRLVFDYPPMIGSMINVIKVSSYYLDLKFAPPDVLDFVPKNWQPGTTECELHHEPLLRGRVPIGYGMLWPRVGELEATEKESPNARLSVEAGCITNDEPKFAEVLYCPKCRAAAAVWYKEHPSKFTY